jgi:hypothetical protein
MSSWSARCGPTGASASTCARTSATTRAATCSALTRRSPNAQNSSVPCSASIHTISALPGPALSTSTTRTSSRSRPSSLRTTRSSRSPIDFGRCAEQGPRAAADHLPRGCTARAAQRVPALDLDHEAAAARRVEPVADQVGVDLRAHRRSSGRNTSAMNSKGGAIGLWVPPSKVRRELAGREQQRPQHRLQHERDRARAADREGVVAVADRARREHQLGAEPSSSPTTWAAPIVVAARTAVRCWRSSPA